MEIDLIDAAKSGDIDAVKSAIVTADPETLRAAYLAVNAEINRPRALGEIRYSVVEDRQEACREVIWKAIDALPKAAPPKAAPPSIIKYHGGSRGEGFWEKTGSPQEIMEWGISWGEADMIEFACHNGADPDHGGGGPRGSHLWDALIAGRTETARALVDAGADVCRYSTWWPHTPLFAALSCRVPVHWGMDPTIEKMERQEAEYIRRRMETLKWLARELRSKATPQGGVAQWELASSLVAKENSEDPCPRWRAYISDRKALVERELAFHKKKLQEEQSLRESVDRCMPVDNIYREMRLSESNADAHYSNGAIYIGLSGHPAAAIISEGKAPGKYVVNGSEESLGGALSTLRAHGATFPTHWP